MLRFRPAGLYLLADNHSITDFEYSSAEPLRQSIGRAVDNRSQYIEENGLDRDFCIPAGLWDENAPNDYIQAFKRVRNGDKTVLNNLLFYCQCFSGYQMLSWRHAEGLGSVTSVPEDYDNKIRVSNPKPDKWVKHWIRSIKSIPFDLVYSPAKKLGNVGWNYGGVLVNHDTYVYQERINLLYENRIFDLLPSIRKDFRPTRILEIGGGYGGLAQALKDCVPNSQYFIVDLPESLMFAACYLKLTRPQARILVLEPGNRLREADISYHDFVLIPNYLFGELINSQLKFDLALNTLSMAEMSTHQIQVYGKGIQEMIGDDGVFFEQNQDNRKIGLNFCSEVLGAAFKFNKLLSHKMCGRTEGVPNLWANRSLAEFEPRQLLPEPLMERPRSKLRSLVISIRS